MMAKCTEWICYALISDIMSYPTALPLTFSYYELFSYLNFNKYAIASVMQKLQQSLDDFKVTGYRIP